MTSDGMFYIQMLTQNFSSNFNWDVCVFIGHVLLDIICLMFYNK